MCNFAGVCGSALVSVCRLTVCVPAEACVHMYVWCVLTLRCSMLVWFYR